jgi:hypothetical protein
LRKKNCRVWKKIKKDDTNVGLWMYYSLLYNCIICLLLCFYPFKPRNALIEWKVRRTKISFTTHACA